MAAGWGHIRAYSGLAPPYTRQTAYSNEKGDRYGICPPSSENAGYKLAIALVLCFSLAQFLLQQFA